MQWKSGSVQSSTQALAECQYAVCCEPTRAYARCNACMTLQGRDMCNHVMPCQHSLCRAYCVGQTVHSHNLQMLIVTKPKGTGCVLAMNAYRGVAGRWSATPSPRQPQLLPAVSVQVHLQPLTKVVSSLLQSEQLPPLPNPVSAATASCETLYG